MHVRLSIRKKEEEAQRNAEVLAAQLASSTPTPAGNLSQDSCKLYYLLNIMKYWHASIQQTKEALRMHCKLCPCILATMILEKCWRTG